MKKVFIITQCIFFCVSQIVYAQNDSNNIDPNTAKDDGDIFFYNALSYCKYNLTKEVYCKESAGFYEEALKYYLVADKINKNNVDLNFKIGICYFISNNCDKALPFLEAAYKQDEKIDPQIEYYLARSYQNVGQWQSATEFYKLFSEKCKSGKISKNLIVDDSEILLHIKECKTGDSLSRITPNYVVKNLGSKINTKYSDYSPVLTASGYTMLYTSKRPDYRLKNEEVDSIDFEADAENYIENIFISYTKEGEWSESKRIGDILTIVGEHYAILDISSNSEKCLLYRSKNGGDIFEGNFAEGDWKGMKKVDAINSGQFEPTAVYSHDMNSIYFISTRPGGFGGKDIYYAEKDLNGEFQKPQNIGDIINTPFDEDGIHFLNDTTMYFGSKGHNGIGGYDIFKTVKRNGQWTKPVNCGYPLNTPYNDVFFSISPDSTWAYLASDRHGSIGLLDIFTVKFSIKGINEQTTTQARKIIKPEIKAASDSLAYLKGSVLSYETNSGLEAYIEVKNSFDSVLYYFPTDKSGNYELNIIKDSSYIITIVSEGYSIFYDTILLRIIPQQYSYTSKLIKNKDCIFKSEQPDIKPDVASTVAMVYVTDYNGNEIDADIEIIDSETNKTIFKGRNTKNAIKLEKEKQYSININSDGYMHTSGVFGTVASKDYIDVQAQLTSANDTLGRMSELVVQEFRFINYYGEVIDYSTQQYIKNASISLIDAKNDNIIKQFVVPNGKYTLQLLPHKKYYIVTEADGYINQSETIQLTQSDNDITQTECLYKKGIIDREPSMFNKYDRNILLSGEILAFNSQANIESKVSFYDKDSDSLLLATQSNNKGKFKVIIPGNKYYKVEIDADGYLHQSGYINSTKSSDVIFTQIQALQIADGVLKNNVDELLVKRFQYNFATVNFRIFNQMTGQPLDAEISVIQPEINYIVNSSTLDANSYIPLIQTKEYECTISAKGYATRTEKIFVSDTSSKYSLTVYMVPLSIKNINLAFPNILFSTARFDIKSDYAADMAQFAKIVASNSSIFLTLTGHADNRGSENANMRLSRKRAESVAKFLIKNGIPSNRIKIEAYGESMPIGDNETEEGQALNRRVEFKVEVNN